MRAIVVQELGGPDVMRLEQVPDPVAVDGQVVIRVEAAGVNHMDLAMRAAMAPSLPFTPGLDAAGVRVDTGERVLVSGTPGCYAQLVAAPAEQAWPLPAAVDGATAVAIGVPYRLAYRSLVTLGELAAGQTLLVQAGSSATGTAAVELGRALGAKVYATASAGKHDRLRALGAEPLAYDDAALGELGADLVFDPVGGEGFARSVESLGDDGRLVTPGALGDPMVGFNVWTLMERRLRIIGAGAVPAIRADFEHLVEMVAAGRLRPAIDRQLPLGQAAEAHRLVEGREVFGKIVLVPGED